MTLYLRRIIEFATKVAIGPKELNTHFSVIIYHYYGDMYKENSYKYYLVQGV